MLGLRTVIYKVGDIAKATEWYTKAFETAPYFNEPFYVSFNIRGYELGLQPEKNPATEKPESVTALWGVEQIEAEYQRLLKLGAAEYERPTAVGGALMVASVKDPWGNILGLIYNPEFKLPDSYEK
ncbi:VOC family protein [Maribacter sp.]|nr:VOC family protein [Maribacter sp.]